MTTTKNPVSRKSGAIALSCSLLALTLLSGCNLRSCMEPAEPLKEDCVRNGGVSTISVSYSVLPWFFPTVNHSCTVPPSSEGGVKK
jgi:hypothetical protein